VKHDGNLRIATLSDKPPHHGPLEVSHGTTGAFDLPASRSTRKLAAAGCCPALLVRLEASFYPLLGRKAAAYNGGVHTKHRHTRYHEFFTGRIGPGERVLDIGCGIGALAYEVAEKSGAFVVGIDINRNHIQRACREYSHPRVEYKVADALKEIPDQRFDVIILSNVLEHLPQRSAFLKKVQAITRSSRLLIRVPLFERHWSVPLKQELGVEWRLDPTHQTEYTLESFLAEMQAAGLRITHQETRWGEIWAEVTPDYKRSDERQLGVPGMGC
jgi:ubiquinone/menaquinone biosynthesis C-methylase UbiE